MVTAQAVGIVVCSKNLCLISTKVAGCGCGVWISLKSTILKEEILQ